MHKCQELWITLRFTTGVPQTCTLCPLTRKTVDCTVALKAAWFLSIGRALAATILWFNLDCRAYPERRLLKSINSFPLFSYICTGVCNFSLFALLESYCHHQEKCSVSSWGSAKEGLILLLDTQIGLVTKLTFISISQLWLKFSSDWPKFWAKSTLFLP